MKPFFQIKRRSLLADVYRPELDGIRALAILMVLLGHIAMKFVPFGFLGVDIFFVLSGYVICNSFFKSINFNFKVFILRRFARIFPGVFAVLIIVLSIPSLRSDISWIEVSKVLFLAKNFGEWYWPLGPFWSLSAEEQFYVSSAVLLALYKSGYFKVRMSTALACYALMVLILGFVLTFSNHNFNSPTFLNIVFLRPSEIAFGVLLSIRENNFVFEYLRKINPIAQWLTFCLLFFSGLYYESSTLISLFTIFIIILTKVGNLRILMNILKNRVMVSIGILSYSIYIWHVPVILLLPKISNKFLLFFLDILAILIVAYISYIFVERPSRDYINSRIAR